MVLGCLVLGPAWAVNPADDDAGTGADAGDHHLVATPILPGSYAGHLLGGPDTFDYYTFAGDAGDFVQVGVQSTAGFWLSADLLGPGPDPLQPDRYASASGGLTFILPKPGAWYLRFAVSVAAPNPFVDYEYTFAQTHVEGAIIVEISEPSRVYEMSFDETTEVYFWMRNRLDSSDAASAEGSFRAYDLIIRKQPPGSPGSFAAWSVGGTLSSGLLQHVESHDPPVPPADIPLPRIETDAGGSISSRFYAEDVTGHLRVNLFSTAPNSTFDLVFWASAPFAYATAPGGEPFSWTTEDLADGDDVMLPVAMATDAADYGFEAGERMVGYFLPSEAERSATGPDGTDYPAEPDWGMLFYRPQPGSWTLHVGPVSQSVWEDGHAGLDQVLFAGANMPALGIAPDPYLRFPDDV